MDVNLTTKEEDGYIIIEINNNLLEKSNEIKRLTNNKCYWVDKKCPHECLDKCSCDIKLNVQNNVSDYLYLETKTPFLSSIIYAHNEYRDIILNPEDIWYIIISFFCVYLKENKEEVEFYTNIKNINKSIITYNLNKIFSSLKEEVNKEIIDKELKEILKFDFKTNSNVGNLLSNISILSEFKENEDYEYKIFPCGIHNVMFKKDSLEDWKKIIDKLNKLKKYSNDNFIKYIDNILPIIEKFIETYNGKVDKDFWNFIITKDDKIDGWIINLYNGKLKEYTLDIPIEFYIKEEECRDLNVVGGLDGINLIKGKDYDAYEPHSSIIIYHDGNIKSK